jgi:hypothetical protein
VFSSHAHAGQDASIRQAIATDNLTYDTRRIFMENYLRRDCVDTQDHNCNEPAGLRQDGDPSTPLLAAKEGDDILVRLIQGAQEENHIFFMQGAKWLAVPDSSNSGYRAAQHIGISEHFEFGFQVENPSPEKPKDFLYGTTATDNLWDGQWGFLRQLGSSDAETGNTLATLPTNATPDINPPVLQNECGSAFTQRYAVQAWRLRDLLSDDAYQASGIASASSNRAVLGYHNKRDLSDPSAIIYVLKDDLERVRNGSKAPEPLILRARAGDCIEVELTNMMDAEPEDLTNPTTWSWTMMPPITDSLNFNDVRTSRAIGLYAPLVASNVIEHGGSAVGINPSSLAYPCDKSNEDEFCLSRLDDTDGGIEPPEDKYNWDNRATYLWYAGDFRKSPEAYQPTLTPIEFGAIGLQNFADVIKGASHGTIGALVIEPADASWRTDCDILRKLNGADGEQIRDCLNAAATVTTEDGQQFREFVLVYQNDASLRYKGEALANLRNGDDAEDSGQKAFNYAFEPFWTRLDAHPAADPETMMDYDYTDVLSSKPEHGHGDPSTPLFTVAAGMPVRFRLVEPAGHPRNGGFALSGHEWAKSPWQDCSTVQTDDPGSRNSSGDDCFNGLTDGPAPLNRTGTINAMGPGRNENVLLVSAGGSEQLPGDYLYRSPVGFSFGGGQWGIMRVVDPAQCDEEGLLHDARTGRIQVCR